MRITVAVLVALSLNLVLMAASPFLGTWKLNMEKSNPKCSDLSSETMKVTETGPNTYSNVVDSVSKSGEAHHQVFKRTWDGKEHPTGQAGATVTIQQVGSTQKATFKKDGKVTIEGTGVVSADGKVQTRHQVIGACEETLVFERQ